MSCCGVKPLRIEALDLVPNDDKDTCVAVTMLAKRLASSGAETEFIERTSSTALASLGIPDVMVSVTEPAPFFSFLFTPRTGQRAAEPPRVYFTRTLMGRASGILCFHFLGRKRFGSAARCR